MIDPKKYPIQVEVRVKDEAEALLLLQWVADRRGEELQYVSFETGSKFPSKKTTISPSKPTLHRLDDE